MTILDLVDVAKVNFKKRTRKLKGIFQADDEGQFYSDCGQNDYPGQTPSLLINKYTSD